MPIENQEVENEEGQDVEQEALEKEARSMGWRPEDEFRGNKEIWVDAETFVERGRTVLPIVAKNNKALKQQVLQATSRIDTLGEQLSQANQAIANLVKQNAQQARQAAMGIKRTLTAQLKEARTENDVDAELEIQGQLREVQAQIDKKPEEEEVVVKVEENKSDLSPGIVAWMKENDWYNSDKKKTKSFNRFVEDLKDEEAEEIEGLSGKDFLDVAVELFEEQHGKPAKRQSKVESGAHRGGSESTQSSSVKGWNSLPKEAKESAMGFVDDLVGKGKRYKDVKEWQAAYATDYWNGE
jgi:hypothetical protein